MPVEARSTWVLNVYTQRYVSAPVVNLVPEWSGFPEFPVSIALGWNKKNVFDQNVFSNRIQYEKMFSRNDNYRFFNRSVRDNYMP